MADTHHIVILMESAWLAQLCQRILEQEGYTIVLCSPQSTVSELLTTVENGPSPLLLIDSAIEWELGIPLSMRVCADPAFAQVPILLFIHGTNLPDWVTYLSEGSGFPEALRCYMTCPFAPAELISFVRRTLAATYADDRSVAPATPPAAERTAADWQEWRKHLPPFALFEAAEKGDQARAEALVAQGSDVRARNRYGSSPLHYAARRRDLVLIQFLLEQGAEIDVRNTEGETPLHIAARLGDLDLIQFLLRKGAEIDTQNSAGESPLWYAMRSLEIVAMLLLLMRGADPNLANRAGETLLTQPPNSLGETDTGRRQREKARALLLQYAGDKGTI